jgi:hypothetical protein
MHTASSYSENGTVNSCSIGHVDTQHEGECGVAVTLAARLAALSLLTCWIATEDTHCHFHVYRHTCVLFV